MPNPYYQPYWVDIDFLEHHGVKGQKWGVRRYQDKDGSLLLKEKNRYNSKPSLNKSKTKRAIAIGGMAAVGALAVYGGYKYGKFISNENVKLAIEKGKKYAAKMKQMDAAINKKYPELEVIKPDSFYDKYIKEYADKAKSQKFSEAYANVKRAKNNIKKKEFERKKLINSARRTIKELRTGKLGFGTLSTFRLLQENNPDILRELGVSASNGTIYLNGKKIY